MGLTTAGGIAIKTETGIGENAKLTAGAEIKDEKTRWGIKIDWRF